VQTAPEYKVSSGLLSPRFFDWPGYIADQVGSSEPDIVIFMVGANDANGVTESYRQYVDAVMDEVRAPGRLVVWVGQPNMGPNRPDLQARIPYMNQVFQEEAAARPGVLFVDTWDVTSDVTGAYSAYLPNEDGVPVLVRTDDGVHFTPEGGRRLAVTVVNAILAALKIG
jgi:hypothetical protein